MDRPRYAPSTTKADWIAYSESLEAEVAELRKRVEALTKALVALVDVQPYVFANPNSHNARRWEERREAALDLAAAALATTQN